MAIFRQYIAPFLIVLVFLFALLAVGARSFLPNDMAAPAPVEEVGANSLEPIQAASDTVAGLPPALQVLVKGLPEDPALSGQLGVSVN